MRLQDLPATLSIAQAAEILGVGRDLAYRAARSGQLPTVRVGRRLLVRTDPLLELLGARPRGCTARQGEDTLAEALSWQDGPKTGAEAAQLIADTVMGCDDHSPRIKTRCWSPRHDPDPDGRCYAA